MNLAELITYSFFGILLFIIIAVVWFVFRKRKKWAMAITAILLIGYIGYYAYYPILQANQHAEKYGQIKEYLATNYPEQEFIVEPEHYGAGVTVGSFDISDKATPKMGVTLYVDEDGQVEQISNWTNSNFPQQQDVWRELEFHYGDNYTLDKEAVEITKQDEWIDGELTVFALNINGNPAIAVYEYSYGGYGTLALEESQNGDFVSAEIDGRVFIYIDERYAEETAEIKTQNSQTITIDAAEHKGRLFVAE